MTVQCEQCGAPFSPQGTRGPRPRFCSDAHRAAWHRDYRNRRAAVDALFRQEIVTLLGVSAADAAAILAAIDRRIGERGATPPHL